MGLFQRIRRVVVSIAASCITSFVAFAGSHSQTGAITNDIGRLYAGAGDSVGKITEFRRIEASAFGATWPLKAQVAYLGCVLAEGNATTIIVTDGVPLAATVEARNAAKVRGYEIEVLGARVKVESARDPRAWTLEDAEFKGLTKSLTPLSDVGNRIGCLSKAAQVVE